jgi:hypothetical protein
VQGELTPGRASSGEHQWEAEVLVEFQPPRQRLDSDFSRAWSQVGEHLANGQWHADGRFDRLETDVAVLKTDVAVLKTDVAVLKTDVAELKADVAQLKVDTKRGFDRMEARFEQLTAYIIRDETRNTRK